MFKGFLPHYAKLLKNQDIAYYMLCKTIEVEWDSNSSLKELWDAHKHGEELFLQNKESNNHVNDLNNRTTQTDIDKTFLRLKIEIVDHLLHRCIFCENQCKIDRTEQRGTCGINDTARVSSVFLHHGEEPPLVPSGTIFFSGCTFDCVFCQNWNISNVGKKKYEKKKKAIITSHRGSGTKVSPLDLAEFANQLEAKGARNINYVGGDPTPNLHTIIGSLQYQRNNICQLWNSNFFNTIESLKLLREIMDFWLPDFKYGNNKCGQRYSGVKNYWDVITRNLKFIYDWGSRDIIIRHLVMPGHLDCCTEPILKWISNNIPEVVVNIMGQYRPEHLVDNNHYSEINRRITKNEMAHAYALAEGLGIEYRLAS